MVYVSPLKALAYDIERNLRAPLRGIGAEDVSVGIRTGDTPQRERAAMARKPPDILITTPESLYLILTSRAREMLSAVEAVIVDEIHAVANSKRGAHLALTLERLEEQARAGGRGRDVQRIGLSATQSPLEEIGRFLVGPRREVTIVDAGVRKPLDLRIEVPVESMTEPGQLAGDEQRDPLEPLPGGEPTRASIWPAIYPELLRARAGAPLDDHLRQQPPLGRARGAAPERAGAQAARRRVEDDDRAASGGGGAAGARRGPGRQWRRGRSRARTTARSRARSARRSRSC